MSFSIKAFVCISLLGAMGFLAAGPGSQDGAVKPGGDAPVTDAPVTDAPGKQQGGAPQTVRDRYEEAFLVQSDYRVILDIFRGTPEGPEKEAKRAALKKKLAEIFDADMKARRAQAEEIEKRLNKLQEQYKAREAAKERIIDLQIEVLEKDAEGLGFPRDKFLVGPNGFSGQRIVSPENTHGPTLRDLSQSVYGLRTEELKKKGHFVVSNDETMFAYVGVNYPNGPSKVYLQESATGKSLATYDTDGVVSEIRFQEGGVGVRMPKGKFEVRIPLGAESVNVRPGPSDAQVAADHPLTKASMLAADNAGGGELDDYSKLRNRYLKAKEEFDRISKDWKNTVEEDRKKEPNVSIDELRARYHTFTPGFDWARNAFQEASAILDTKLKLLALDVESAKASFGLAEADYARAESINKSKPNAVNDLEFRRLQAQMDKHKIELMRAETILNLFQSIKTEGEPKPEAAKR